MSLNADSESQDSIKCDCPQISKPGQSSKSIADFSESEKLRETGGLEILEEFKKLYETRIDEVDQSTSISEFERISTKLKIMTEWVKDLKEQNVMLVRTVEDLEKAALCRVKLLEDKLLQSSNLVSENIAQCTNSGEALETLSNRISDLEKDEYLERKVKCLQSDIRGLLEVIRRGHDENCWNNEDITFFEIKPEDIPVLHHCSCNEERKGSQNQQSDYILKAMQNRENMLLEKQVMLEQQVSKKDKIILQKEEAYKTVLSKVQTLTDILRKKYCNCTISDTSNNLDFDIMQLADVLDSAFVTKELEIKDLHQCLQESNVKLEKLLHENNKFEEKSKRIEELETQLVALHKESLESKEALASEVAEKYDQVMALRKEVQTLEDKCHHLNMQTLFKDDIIKDMRKKLKEAAQKDTPRHVRISNDPSSEVTNEDSSYNESEAVLYLSKTKQLMEKEKEAMAVLKEEIEKVITELHNKKKQEVRGIFLLVCKKLHDLEIMVKNYKVMESNGSVEGIKNCFTDIEENVASLELSLQNSLTNSEEKCQSNVEDIIQRLCRVTDKISEICSKKEETSNDSSVEEESKTCGSNCNDPSHELAIKTFLQQFKRMEEFRICTVEAQAATEDLRDEMETVTCNFTCRHEKYCELDKLITEVQNYLISTKEKVFKTISQLKLQKEERIRYNERISYSGDKLKEKKNEINQARIRLSRMEDSQELGNVGFTEICTSNLDIVADEVEEIVSNLRIIQDKDNRTILLLSELDMQLSNVENNLNKLCNKSQEVLEVNEKNQKIFEEREKYISKLEKELDCTHTNMQDTLETISTAMEQINELDVVEENHLVNQDLTDIIKTKDEYHKLKREYENFKMKMIENSFKKEVDESVNDCKCQINMLKEQIKRLQNELKIVQDANFFLKNNILLLEKELDGAHKKSDDSKRTYSNESMQFNRKISDLESTLKRQKEIESNLRRNLASSEIELNKSKEILNSFQISSEGTSSTLGTQFKLEGVPQLIKDLQDTIRETRKGLIDLRKTLENMLREGSSDSASIMAAIDRLVIHGTNVENCFAEIEKLRCALYSKEKLLEDKEKIITIQKESIQLSQNELKDLHEKLQEKIDAQTNVITHLDKDNKQLQNKIELQVQTIGHLQNAVVQTKRCLDQMGQKFVSDNEKKNEVIRTLNIFLNETQHQYSECFAEAAKQDSLLELQRDSIESLQQKIICKEYNELYTIILLHCIYSANIFHLQDQLKTCHTDCETLKSQFESLKKTNFSLEEKYLSAKYLWEVTESKLKCCLSNQGQEIKNLIEKNKDLKIELQKHKIEFEIIQEELRKECTECIPKLKSEVEKLSSEIQDLTTELEKKKNQNEDLIKKLDSFEERISQQEVSQGEQIQNHKEQINCCESIIVDQTQLIEELKTKLRQEEDNYNSEINMLKRLLNEKSDCMVKLQADYQMLKNDLSILKKEYEMFETKAKEEILELRSKKKEVFQQLEIVEDSYSSVTQDFEKSQQLLSESVKREVELQQNLTDLEKSFYPKIMHKEEEEIRLKELVKKLKEELELARKEVSSKKLEFQKVHSACNFYCSQLENTQHELQGLKKINLRIEDENCCIKKKLQDSREENCKLLNQIKFLEQNSYKCGNELEDMHNLLVDLKKECKMKNKSLASMTVELSQATASRSELLNESQYVVSCIRDWMEEQNNIVDDLNAKLKTKQEQLMRLGLEKKTLLSIVKEQKRPINSRLLKRKRPQRFCLGTKNNYIKNYSPELGVINRSESNSSFSLTSKKSLSKKSKRQVYESSWFFPKLEFLTEALRQHNGFFKEKMNLQSENDLGFDENRDCGYQSSTSK